MNGRHPVSTFTQIYYHIVYSTRPRAPVLRAERRRDLFKWKGRRARAMGFDPFRVEDSRGIGPWVSPTAIRIRSLQDRAESGVVTRGFRPRLFGFDPFRIGRNLASSLRQHELLLLAQCFQTVDEASFPKDEVTFSTIWGVCDEDLYRRVLKECDKSFAAGKPFLSYLLTVSNHRPYTYPPKIIAPAP